MTTDLRPLPDRLNPAQIAALHDAARQRAAQLRAEAIADAAVWLLRSVVAPAVAGVAEPVQAVASAVRRRRPIQPTKPVPSAMSAQVSGSGIACVIAAEAKPCMAEPAPR